MSHNRRRQKINKNQAWIQTMVINIIQYLRNIRGTYRLATKTVQVKKRYHTGEISAHLVWAQPSRTIPAFLT